MKGLLQGAELGPATLQAYHGATNATLRQVALEVVGNEDIAERIAVLPLFAFESGDSTFAVCLIEGPVHPGNLSVRLIGGWKVSLPTAVIGRQATEMELLCVVVTRAKQWLIDAWEKHRSEGNGESSQ